MGEGIVGLSRAYEVLFTAVLVVLAVLVLLCLVRAIKGPQVTDRVVAVNMMGTMIMVMIGILALKLQEGYLMDIALIYALLSFLAVVVIAKIYLGVYKEEGAKAQQLSEGAPVLSGKGDARDDSD